MKYTTPEMEIVRFEVEEVIVASGNTPETCTEDGCTIDVGDF